MDTPGPCAPEKSIDDHFVSHLLLHKHLQTTLASELLLERKSDRGRKRKYIETIINSSSRGDLGSAGTAFRRMQPTETQRMFRLSPDQLAALVIALDPILLGNRKKWSGRITTEVMLKDLLTYLASGSDMYHNSAASGISPSSTCRHMGMVLDAMHGLANLTEVALPARPLKGDELAETIYKEEVNEARQQAGERILNGQPTLAMQVMAYPSPRGVFRMLLRFTQLRQVLPGTLAVLDGKFIPCYAPLGYIEDFKGIKGQGLTLHAVCDADRRIIDCVPGYVATTHDSTIFSNSNFGERAGNASKRRRIFADAVRSGNLSKDGYKAQHKQLIRDFDSGILPFPVHTEIPLFAIGDGAYPLSAHLLTPFSNSHRKFGSVEQQLSLWMSSIRVRSEHLFGVLVKQWRSLDDAQEHGTQMKKIRLICIFHNWIQLFPKDFAKEDPLRWTRPPWVLELMHRTRPLTAPASIGWVPLPHDVLRPTAGRSADGLFHSREVARATVIQAFAQTRALREEARAAVAVGGSGSIAMSALVHPVDETLVQPQSRVEQLMADGVAEAAVRPRQSGVNNDDVKRGLAKRFKNGGRLKEGSRVREYLGKYMFPKKGKKSKSARRIGWPAFLRRHGPVF